MNRPLLPHEWVEIELSNLDEVPPAVANLIACTMFQMGLLLGGYPSGRVRVMLCKEEATEMLRLHVSMTIPWEDLGL